MRLSKTGEASGNSRPFQECSPCSPHPPSWSGDQTIGPCSNELAVPPLPGNGRLLELGAPPLARTAAGLTTPRTPALLRRSKPAVLFPPTLRTTPRRKHTVIMKTTVRLWRRPVLAQRRAFSSSARRLDNYAFIGLGQMVCVILVCFLVSGLNLLTFRNRGTRWRGISKQSCHQATPSASSTSTRLQRTSWCRRWPANKPAAHLRKWLRAQQTQPGMRYVVISSLLFFFFSFGLL